MKSGEVEKLNVGVVLACRRRQHLSLLDRGTGPDLLSKVGVFVLHSTQ